ncbi:MAG: substrate-binding domain-containing protein [Planctomycetaceae bacterium]|nr:substrate-binding domain-containing protein [Planctomycetaceae bacterium]
MLSDKLWQSPFAVFAGLLLIVTLTGCPGEVPQQGADGKTDGGTWTPESENRQEVMIFVGRIEQDNARLRRQGLIDELLGRAYDPDNFDEPGQIVGGNGVSILGTRTDNFDFSKAKSQAEDALTAHPNLACMVGLFAYNPPNILEALLGAGKLGEVNVVGFDEADETLQAIEDGYCYGTVVQDPYRYGFESVRILAGLARDDDSVIPEGGFLDIPAKKITQENVVEFRSHLKELLDAGEQGAAESLSETASGDRPTVAFVTNGIASFWVIAEAGARAAGKEFGVNVEVRMPPEGVADQRRMLEELLTLGVAGIAVSPIDPENEADILNTCGEQTNLITHDSDAPTTNRICYVGMSNYDAGRMCGELVREVLDREKASADVPATQDQ